ncbi:MAG: AAA family ATPase [Micromonosporaceae bacterium]
MLLAFRVANYRSIRDMQELSFVATSFNERSAVAVPAAPRGPISVLPVIGVYGPNASGKTNVLRALGDMRALLSGDTYMDASPWHRGGWFAKPFLLDQQARQEVSLLEADLLISEVRHTYGLEFDKDGFAREWLHAYPHGKRQVWFTRSREEGLSFPGDHVKGSKSALRKILRPDQLMLSLASTPLLTQMAPVASWFADNLISTLDPVEARRQRSPRGERLLAAFFQGNTQAQALVRRADIGIDSVRTRKYEAPTGDDLGIELHHLSSDGFTAALPFSEESAGTVSWIWLLPKLLRALDRGGTLIVDELDSSLHPHLAAEVIRMFQDPAVNPQHAQLLFTSHDVAMLGTQFGAPLLDRDQVWFTEKRGDGATELYPLVDFKPRKSENLERGYLSGRYGAVPDLSPGEIGRSLRVLREDSA